MGDILLVLFVVLLVAWIVIDCVMIRRNVSMFEEFQSKILRALRSPLCALFNDLEEIKRLVSINRTPRVYLKGETMDGKNLVYTVVQPEKTAGDIKEWTISILIDGVVRGTYTIPIEKEAFDFKVPKGTQAIRVSVAFTDTSDNPGDATLSELFDAIDTIAPPAPGNVTLTVREEIEADADLPVVASGGDEEAGRNEESPIENPDEGNTENGNQENTDLQA